MACQAVQTWSVIGLVASFLDLAIAYSLLCLSSLAYFASKSLGFLGLNLPCPCDVIFSNIYGKILCLNTLLVDFPTHKVSGVHLSVKQKFPCNCPKKQSCLIDGDDCVNEIEGEDASCSSVSDSKRSVDLGMKEMSGRAGKYDVKGKGVINHRPRSRWRNRKTGSAHGKDSSVSLCDAHVPGGYGLIEGSSVPVDNAEAHHYLEYDNKFPTKLGEWQRSITCVEMNHSSDPIMHKNKIYIEELPDNPQGVQTFSGDEKNAVRILEKRLEEERIARAALYIELEKERSAAASAADEAMAMILRLQEEKASIEIEARQYQRILEEKSAYDAEEMNILKEILVRREKEKLFLEKEVEAYRQMFSLGNEQLATDDLDKSEARQFASSLLDPYDDPVLFLYQFTESTDQKVMKESKSSDGVVFTDKPNSKPAAFGNERSSFGKQDDNSVHVSVCNSVEEMDLQEKEIISAKKIQDENQGQKLTEKIIVTCNGTEKSEPCYDPSLKQETKDAILDVTTSCDQMIDKDPLVYDVHIIGDEINSCSEAVTNMLRVITDYPSGSRLPPIKPRGLNSLSEQRSCSLSSVDNEMLKIDIEIGRLRERLKLVQEGRDKLSLSAESRERENIELKLLEDISRQVQEIRLLTDPATSKALSKKRRSRSFSSGLQRSSVG